MLYMDIIDVALRSVRPILTYRGGCWPLSQKDGNMFRIFERRILGMIYDPVNDNGIWTAKYGNELCTLFDRTGHG
jgi:hypothetical protein